MLQPPPSTTTQGPCHLQILHGMILLLGHLNRGLTPEPKKADHRTDPIICNSTGLPNPIHFWEFKPRNTEIICNWVLEAGIEQLLCQVAGNSIVSYGYAELRGDQKQGISRATFGMWLHYNNISTLYQQVWWPNSSCSCCWWSQEQPDLRTLTPVPLSSTW